MAAADADVPTLPSGYFASPESTQWSWKDDFDTITEIGKGKVGGAARWAGSGVWGAATSARSTHHCGCRAGTLESGAVEHTLLVSRHMNQGSTAYHINGSRPAPVQPSQPTTLGAKLLLLPPVAT